TAYEISRDWSSDVCSSDLIAYARRFLDDTAPLQNGTHADAVSYAIADGALRVTLKDGTHTSLAEPELLLGYRGSLEAPEAIVFRHHGLHFELQIDRNHPIGSQAAAGGKDIVMEAAVTP